LIGGQQICKKVKEKLEEKVAKKSKVNLANHLVLCALLMLRYIEFD
jgi:hypothetical protein